MRSREFQRMLVQASTLTPTQRQELVRALSQTNEMAQVVQTLQARSLNCPHCNDERVVRNGHASGLQRCKCRGCAKTFNSLTATPLARLRHKDRWERQADVLRQGLSMHQAAEVLAVAPSTAFRWRHRFLQLPQSLEAATLQGLVEADETYILRSNKGQRVQARKARRRGGSAAKRGLSEEQEPVLVVRAAPARRRASLWSVPTRPTRRRLSVRCWWSTRCCAPMAAVRWRLRRANWGSSTMP